MIKSTMGGKLWIAPAIAMSVAAALMLVSGCSASSDATPTKIQDNTVVAETRNIVSVVVVDGKVEARPIVAIAAPLGGAVSMQVVAGTNVEPGTRLGTVGNDAIISTLRGTVTDILVNNHDVITANVPVATLAYAGFGVRIVIPPEQLFRLYEKPTVAKVNVSAGPAGLDCALAPAPIEPGADSAPVFCLIPLDATVVPGLPAKVGVNTGHKDSVIALPVSAVSGSAGQGEVTIVRGEQRIRTKVRLGITDGAYIEILDGIHAGDVVLAYAPLLE